MFIFISVMSDFSAGRGDVNREGTDLARHKSYDYGNLEGFIYLLAVIWRHCPLCFVNLKWFLSNLRFSQYLGIGRRAHFDRHLSKVIYLLQSSRRLFWILLSSVRKSYSHVTAFICCEWKPWDFVWWPDRLNCAPTRSGAMVTPRRNIKLFITAVNQK